MKKFKKAVALILIFAIIAIIALPASASNLSSYDYCLSIGIPKSTLNTLSKEKMQLIYNEYNGKDVIVTVGEKTFTVNENFSSKSVTLNGSIQTSHMSLSIVYISLYNNNKLTQLECIADFAWKGTRPNYRKVDSLAVNWDSSLFAYKSGSFSAQDVYWLNNTKCVYKYHSTPSVINQGGLGWYAYLFGTNDLRPAPCGVADWKLYPKRNMYKGNSTVTNVALQYVHNYSIFQASLGFSLSGPSIGISTNISCDEMATSFDFWYRT